MEQYYTPAIEDIRVGYELEYHNWSMDEMGVPELNYDRWDKTILEKWNVENLVKYGVKGVRVPYITKEQIEAEGWAVITEESLYKGMLTTVKDNGHTYYCRIYDGQNIFISQYRPASGNLWSMSMKSTLFDGKCPSINEFRYICKLLNIN